MNPLVTFAILGQFAREDEQRRQNEEARAVYRLAFHRFGALFAGIKTEREKQGLRGFACFDCDTCPHPCPQLGLADAWEGPSWNGAHIIRR